MAFLKIGTRQISVQVGQNLLNACLDQDIHIEHACGGHCACSTCHIYVHSGAESLSEATDEELDRLDSAKAVNLKSRLACQALLVKKGDEVIEISLP